jgi:hypothetical protein
MITAMDTMEPADVIVAALRLARERVTGDDPDAKEREREKLADLIARVQMHREKPEAEGRPSAEELAGALGDPEDERLRRAINVGWGGE